jgi:ABC-type antimicrobial peptide transport system permease subunit
MAALLRDIRYSMRTLVAARLLWGLLFGVTPANVTTLLAVGAALAAVAAAASLLTALRAARLDPSRALRTVGP